MVLELELICIIQQLLFDQFNQIIVVLELWLLLLVVEVNQNELCYSYYVVGVVLILVWEQVIVLVMMCMCEQYGIMGFMLQELGFVVEGNVGVFWFIIYYQVGQDGVVCVVVMISMQELQVVWNEVCVCVNEQVLVLELFELCIVVLLVGEQEVYWQVLQEVNWLGVVQVDVGQVV